MLSTPWSLGFVLAAILGAMLVPGCRPQEGLLDSPRVRSSRTSRSWQSRGLLPGRVGGWKWRTGPRPDLPHHVQLNEPIGSDPEPVFIPAAWHSKVVGARPCRSHRTEQLAINGPGYGSPVGGLRFRRKDDHQQVPSDRRGPCSAAGRAQDAVCRLRTGRSGAGCWATRGCLRADGVRAGPGTIGCQDTIGAGSRLTV